MLMVEEMTTDATDINSITTRFQSGIQQAGRIYNEAKSDSKANVARMLPV